MSIIRRGIYAKVSLEKKQTFDYVNLYVIRHTNVHLE